MKNKILVIEDDRAISELLCMNLTIAGYETVAAYDEDYMVKPFDMLELLVRIEKILERTGRAKRILTIKNIQADLQSHQILKDGIPVNLKPLEYDLFILLLQNKNIALGREELLKRVWGEEYLGESRTVDVHIGQLRKKLELYDEIKTIPKLGYRLED